MSEVFISIYPPYATFLRSDSLTFVDMASSCYALYIFDYIYVYFCTALCVCVCVTVVMAWNMGLTAFLSPQCCSAEVLLIARQEAAAPYRPQPTGVLVRRICDVNAELHLLTRPSDYELWSHHHQRERKKSPVGGGSCSEKPPSCHQYAHHEPAVEHQIDCRIKCTLSIVTKATFAVVGVNAKSNYYTGAAVRGGDVVIIIIFALLHFVLHNEIKRGYVYLKICFKGRRFSGIS